MKKITQIVLLTVALAGFAAANDRPLAPTVPEIDASTAVTAVGLLAGGLLVVRAWRKK
jgi:hypothetical protein